MKGLISATLAVSLLLVSCGGTKEDASSSETVSETITVGTFEEDVFDIETPYCTLKFPAEWENRAEVTKIDGEPYTVRFSVTETDILLMDIIFGDTEDYCLGILKTGDEEISVRIKTYEIDSDSPDFEEYCAMQDDVNVIINRLNSEYEIELSV